jgi:ubiquinone/menaquinone biosynthesis C-methylase UbiE
MQQPLQHHKAGPVEVPVPCPLRSGTTSCDRLKERLYSPWHWDNDAVFLEMIESRIGPGSMVLDLGAGAGCKFPYDLKSKVEPGGEIVGADFDDRVLDNPLVDRGAVLEGSGFPFADDTFDVVFTRYVLEHVAEPEEFLSEVSRVLKPGGSFLFLTPNKWHYVCLVARCTPESFHEFYNRRRGRDETDTFATVYRLNTRSAIRRHLKEAGFLERELSMRECCPNYLTLAAPLFLIGVAYERLVNSTALLAGLRVNILGHFVKTTSVARNV